jgi:putative intracellular protease/amidase
MIFVAMTVIFSGMVIYQFTYLKDSDNTAALCHTPLFMISFGTNFLTSIFFLIVGVKITKAVNKINRMVMAN